MGFVISVPTPNRAAREGEMMKTKLIGMPFITLPILSHPFRFHTMGNCRSSVQHSDRDVADTH